MSQRRELVRLIIIFVFLSFVILLVGASNLFGIRGVVGRALLPLEKALFHSSQVPIGEDQMVAKLQKEKRDLEFRLVEMKKFEEDNKALRDQFENSSLPQNHVVAGEIVGAPGFIPGISIPEYLVIDKGTSDGIKDTYPVVYKNALIGKIKNATEHFSQVILVTKRDMSITVKDQDTGALGVVRGLGGGEMLVDNVILSDKLKIGDTIVTFGDQNTHGEGLPPGLVVGEITSIEKTQSALFQKASLQTPIDVIHMSTVFVITSQ